MGALVVLLALAAVSGGVVLWRCYRSDRLERLRYQARLGAIEAQLAGLRAALRIRAAEHIALRRIAHQIGDADEYCADNADTRPL